MSTGSGRGVQGALPGLHPAREDVAQWLNLWSATHPTWQPWTRDEVPAWAAGLDPAEWMVASWVWHLITTVYVAGTVDMFDFDTIPTGAQAALRATLAAQGRGPLTCWTVADLRPGAGRAVLSALAAAGLVELTTRNGIDRWSSYPARTHTAPDEHGVGGAA